MSDYTTTFRRGKDGPVYTVTLKDIDPHQTRPALYHVSCSERDRAIEVTRTAAVTTEHAAVNGMQNDLDRAAFVMYDKVAATADLRRGDGPAEFTLYHVPTRGVTMDLALAGTEIAGRPTADSTNLAAVLEASGQSSHPVVWSVHSRGAAVFDVAARDCARRGVRLPNESVAVYNGAINERIMKHDLQDAGVATVGRGFYNNPYDPVPQLIGDNTSNPVKRAAALYNTYKVVYSDQSLHTWHVPLKPRDYDSVPPAQWEQPGVDLRSSATRVELPASAIPPTASLNGAHASTLDAATLKAAGIAPGNPTFRLLSETIAARDAYAHGSAAERPALLGSCRQSFQEGLSGPALSGTRLRTAALEYIRGEAPADAVLGAARQHSAAVQREQSLHRAAALPDIGLGR